jgi:hypothetical protein
MSKKEFRKWFDRFIKKYTVRTSDGWNIFGDTYGTDESKKEAQRLFKEDYEEIAKVSFFAGLKSRVRRGERNFPKEENASHLSSDKLRTPLKKFGRVR